MIKDFIITNHLYVGLDTYDIGLGVVLQTKKAYGSYGIKIRLFVLLIFFSLNNDTAELEDLLDGVDIVEGEE